ncbi:protein KRBA1 isoform X7 [Moschus berezovskii]|uniref:protein KRBA1 isoform X7 n=1 Tax=Moschus berezovskii TaxID=68408 RepID=UPI002443A5F0|nr:protein KRBA1 isoform X7 [Moschus berezovskii]
MTPGAALLGGDEPTALRLCPQVSIAFQDLAVRFSEDEWRLLGEGQRALYLDVMRENYDTLASLGTAEPLPLSAFLSPSEPGGAVGARSRAGDKQEPPLGGGPLGGAPQHSLHLSALVQLVQEIPEFLFGEGSPESSGGASLDGAAASPQAVTEDTCPLRDLLHCLPHTPVGRLGLATTPSGSSSSSTPGARGLGSPLPIKTADKPRAVEEGSPGAPGREPSPATCSQGSSKSGRNPERGTPGAGAVGISSGHSPLQGLINCLKEILEPGPQGPEGPRSSPPPPTPSLSASQLTRAELGPVGPPWAVKTEAASGDCPLQGLLNCLKEIPEAPDRHLSPSGANDPQLREDPGAWKRNSGGLRPLQTSPPGPGPGAGSVPSAVKVEDSWPQGPPEPTSCQLNKRHHGPSAASSPRNVRDTAPAQVRVPSWGPAAQAGSASSSPLEALEACLRGIPLSGSLPPQPPASSWSRSPQPGDPGSQRPKLLRLGPHSKEVVMGPLPALGLQGCTRDSPALPLGSQGTPSSFSSSSSSDGDLDFQSPERSQGHQPGKGSPVGSSPLQGLENCLREIPAPRLQPVWPCSSAGDGGPRRAEPRKWAAGTEGLRGEACEPAHLGQCGGDVPARSLRLASPQALASGALPACSPGGPRDLGVARPGQWRWLRDGPATKPSPLHCLENSLKGILPGGPLRFACLVGLGPSPHSSSSSSISSSEGEDPRPEPELWQPLLQERNHAPSGKGLGHPSPHLGGPRAGCSPGEGSRRRESGHRCDLSAAGKAEEKVGGRSHSPWREVCLETPGPPGPLGSAGGGRVQVSPVSVATCVSTPEMLCALPVRSAVHPCPAAQLGRRPGPGPCQPPGSAHGPQSWKLTASEESRSLGPGDGRPGVTAGADGGPLSGGVPQPAPAAAVPGASPGASPQPPCPCGASLQQELRSLGAALSEKLDRLAGALAGLAQEVAAVRTQVDRLGRRPWGAGPKGLHRGPRSASSPAHRHLPYWRHKGPPRPRPKILRGGPAEGCRAGDPSSGLSSGRLRRVPPDTPSAEPPGPGSSPPWQPHSSACSGPAVQTVRHPLGHPEARQSPPPPSLLAAPPPQVAAPVGTAEAEPRGVVAAPPRTPKWPKDPGGLLAGLQRALEGEQWSGELRDPAWAPPSCRLRGLSPAEGAPPLATSPPCSRTFPTSKP